MPQLLKKKKKGENISQESKASSDEQEGLADLYRDGLV